LRLAAEDDALARADCCRSLSQRVVEEIRLAAFDRELDRAIQLSHHLHLVVKVGVVDNLRVVRLESSPNSTRELDVQRVGGQLRELMDPLEGSLDGLDTADGDLRQALRRVRAAQAEVERIVKPRIGS
jgi:hypothetical protein